MVTWFVTHRPTGALIHPLVIVQKIHAEQIRFRDLQKINRILSPILWIMGVRVHRFLRMDKQKGCVLF